MCRAVRWTLCGAWGRSHPAFTRLPAQCEVSRDTDQRGTEQKGMTSLGRHKQRASEGVMEEVTLENTPSGRLEEGALICSRKMPAL